VSYKRTAAHKRTGTAPTEIAPEYFYSTTSYAITIGGFRMFRDRQITKTTRLIVGLIFVLWIIGSLMMSGYLLLQANYYSATGWVIISIVAMFFTYLLFLTPKGRKICSKPISSTISAKANKAGEDLVFLTSTKDQIKVGQIQQALENRGISCVILDQHSTVMIGFLPDVEMRIMVHAKHFENSARIIDDLRKSEEKVDQKGEV
jgi:hypothetical protein